MVTFRPTELVGERRDCSVNEIRVLASKLYELEAGKVAIVGAKNLATGRRTSPI
jgi:hypothetical protein